MLVCFSVAGNPLGGTIRFRLYSAEYGSVCLSTRPSLMSNLAEI